MKKRRKIQLYAVSVISIILIANAVGAFANEISFSQMRIHEFGPDKHVANVGEEVRFTANITGGHDHILDILINFGDGDGEKMNYTSVFMPRLEVNANTTTAEITHVYRREGTYQATLMVLSKLGMNKSAIKHTYIKIKNTPPKFNISVTNNVIADNATYNFEADKPSPPYSQYYDSKYDPEGWKDSSSWASDVRVKDLEDDVHNKVMELYDGSEWRSSGADARNSFASQEDGTVEFWLRRSFGSEKFPNKDSVNTGLFISLKDSYHSPYFQRRDGIKIRIDHEKEEKNNNKIMYFNGDSYTDTNFEIYDDYEWLHFKIKFNCSTKKYKLFLNGFLISDNLPMINCDRDIQSRIFNRCRLRGLLY